MEKYFECTHACLLYNKIKDEILKNKENYENNKKKPTNSNEKETKKANENTDNVKDEVKARSILTTFIIIIVVMIIITILNIIGTIYAFICDYTILGIVSVIGLFFGIPIGMVFYIVYLVNPSIC